MNKTSLIKSQTKTFGPKIFTEGGQTFRITATVRHDDRCGNGHNTFSIVGQIDEKVNGKWRDYCGGCIHDEIAKHFPELADFLKWHLVSTDGPLHYIANTTYHAREHGPNKAWLYMTDKENGIVNKCLKYGDLSEIEKMAESNKNYFIKIDEKTAKTANLEAARSCAIWPEATLADLRSEKMLEMRLPALMEAFQKDVEKLGFIY